MATYHIFFLSEAIEQKYLKVEFSPTRSRYFKLIKRSFRLQYLNGATHKLISSFSFLIIINKKIISVALFIFNIAEQICSRSSSSS